MPGAGRTRKPCVQKGKDAHKSSGKAETVRHSLRDGSFRLLRALPGVPGFLATVADLGVPAAGRNRVSISLIPASGNQDHTA